MSSFEWSAFFAVDDGEGAELISASSPVQLIAPTRIEARVDGTGRLELYYAVDETGILLEHGVLLLGETPARVMLVKTFDPDLTRRTLVWCRFPYVSDLFECSRFLPGVRDQTRREKYLQRALLAASAATTSSAENGDDRSANVLAQLKRLEHDVDDSDSKRLIALMGAPEQRFGDILRDELASPGKGRGEHGPRDKRVFKKFLSVTELWQHQGEHPDLVPPVEREVNGNLQQGQPSIAAQAAEFRWAILPEQQALKRDYRDAARFEISETELNRNWTDSADLLFAKAVVIGHPTLQNALQRALDGFPLPHGPNRALHEEARNRAERVLEYAVERALCGPHSMTRLNACMPKSKKPAVSVAAAALRIFRNELTRQNRRFNTWGEYAFKTNDEPDVETATVGERFDEDVAALLTALDEGEVSQHNLDQAGRRLLDGDATDTEIRNGCIALVVITGCGMKPNWLPGAFDRVRQLHSHPGAEATAHALARVLARA